MERQFIEFIPSKNEENTWECRIENEIIIIGNGELSYIREEFVYIEEDDELEDHSSYEFFGWKEKVPLATYEKEFKDRYKGVWVSKMTEPQKQFLFKKWVRIIS